MPKRNMEGYPINPTLEYERMLSYKEKHSMWYLFETLYWGIFLLSEGILLVKYVTAGMTLATFFGWSFILASIFVIIYGISMTLHLKLMKRYA